MPTQNENNKTDHSSSKHLWRGGVGGISAMIGTHYGFSCPYMCSAARVASVVGASWYIGKRFYAHRTNNQKNLGSHVEDVIQAAIAYGFSHYAYRVASGAYDGFMMNERRRSIDYGMQQLAFHNMSGKQMHRAGLVGFVLPLVASTAIDTASNVFRGSRFGFFSNPQKEIKAAATANEEQVRHKP